MKRKIISLLIFTLILVSTLSCKNSYCIETGIVYLEGSKEVIENGEEIEIKVNLKNAKTSAFNFDLYYDNTKLDYISNIENTNVKNNFISFVWFDESGGGEPKEGELIKFKFRAKEEGIVNFNFQGDFYDSQGNIMKIDFEEKQVKIEEKMNPLKMQLDSKNIENQLDGTQTMEKKNEESMAEENKTINYDKSNANLQSLRLDVEGITPNFESNIYKYYLNIQSNISKIEVFAASENPNSNIDVDGNTNLKEGLNNITITVTSEDKTEKQIYSIQVTKSVNLELANNNLENLAIENVLLNPPFDYQKTNYKIEVSNEQNKLNILAVPQNESAVVNINGNENLKQGENLVTVEVTAPNRI